MAYPGDLSNPVAKSSGAAKTARLTPDDFEQLAAAFRPSWELDDAPFTGAGTMAPADLRALQSGGGTHVDVRVAAHSGLAPAAAAPAPMAPVRAPVPPAVVAPAPVVPALAAPIPPGNGAQLTPGATRAHDPVQKSGQSVITAADIAAAGPLPPPAAPTPLGPPVIARPPPSADRLAKTRIVPRAPVAVPARESTGSFDLGRSPFGRRSKGPLWIGAGVGAVALAAAGIWVAMGNSETKTPPPPPPVLVRTAEPPAIPPPPPETTPTVVAPPPKVTPVAAPPPPAPPPAQAAPPPVVVQQRPVLAPAAPPPARPVYVAPAAPRPAPRPKGGNSTIVHDVPF